MGKKGTLLRVNELYIWSFGGAWSHGRHQRPKTAAAFSLNAAIFFSVDRWVLLVLFCYDVRVGCVQRRLASEKARKSSL